MNTEDINPIFGDNLNKLSARVANEIRRMIASGDLQDGDELGSEASLIKRFNASRPSIREAVRILESEGLLQIVRGARSVKVRMPTADLPAKFTALVLRTRGATAADAYHCRTLIEPAVVREVALKSSQTAPIILNNIIRQEYENLDNRKELLRINNHFHDTLVGFSDNKSAHLILSVLNKIYAPHYERVVTNTDKDTPEKAIKAHEILVHFIEKGQSDRAEQFWHSHLILLEQLMRNSKSYLEMIKI